MGISVIQLSLPGHEADRPVKRALFPRSGGQNSDLVADAVPAWEVACLGHGGLLACFLKIVYLPGPGPKLPRRRSVRLIQLVAKRPLLISVAVILLRRSGSPVPIRCTLSSLVMT
jgi:hypothetical protein